MTVVLCPVDQTKFGSPHGNCLAACVASLTGIPLEELDAALAFRDDDVHWIDRVQTVLTSCGWDVRWDTRAPFDGYNIVSGPAARGLYHAIIMRDGVVVHDPHPSRAGVLEETVYVSLFPVETPT